MQSAVGSGTTTYDTVISSGGVQEIGALGAASGGTVYAGGIEDAAGGGAFDQSMQILSGGEEIVSAGAYTYLTDIAAGGKETLGSGGLSYFRYGRWRERDRFLGRPRQRQHPVQRRDGNDPEQRRFAVCR